MSPGTSLKVEERVPQLNVKHNYASEYSGMIDNIAGLP